ncbi:S8 family peptidase [Anaeromyxobacter oryzae]|uniref:Peptidase S8/S53 domain-containing protein n=1 Tax=Anaeromyxobacter oryzae TaxID=2918170 RepID=A0ABN6MV38_9BACT|nr:S8 family peptidase [Anaeromyxobacter oryzae]BDG03540.1 hypothetical protein AMOR_25360 [Anaeromyxobacter oryzae]
MHAALLERCLAAAAAGVAERVRKAQAVPGLPAATGTYLEFVGEPGHLLNLKSLEAQRQGIEVVAVHTDEVRRGDRSVELERATVFVPHGKVAYFEGKVRQYATETAPVRKPGAEPKPKNLSLVASITDVRLAVLDSLWTDDPKLLPKGGRATWWEVWLRDDGAEVRERFAAAVRPLGIEVGETVLTFPDRTVVLARGTKEQLSASVEALDLIAELRLAKETPYEFLELAVKEQGDWAREFARRTTPAPADSPAVCILDTGINRGHPLLAGSLAAVDCHAHNPAWGTADHNGHGTQMAGLALYGDLLAPLLSSERIMLSHLLESVKVLPPAGKNNPELYGAITAGAIARAEVQAPARHRAVCIAVTTTDFRDRGQPSSWSAEIDKLASGFDDDRRRLILVSAGNTDPSKRHHYPVNTLSEGVHDPGQAWNAVTVGAFTNKVSIKEKDAKKGWKPVAPAGGLSPSSTTALIWDREWANKPDVVFEGGNAGLDPFSGKAFSLDSLSLLTTGARFAPPEPRPFMAMGETSAAVAQGSRFAATIHARYPHFWPETIRALMVHSARWTPPMLSLAKGKKLNLLRTCGFGVPDLQRASWSASNALTLIVQDDLQPFERDEMKELKVFPLPWPRAELLRLGPVDVELRVTLSYFIEPNPARRGWRDRHRYASYGLRWEVIRPAEKHATFLQRVNKAAREDKADRSRQRDTDKWTLGPTLREHGSIHSDVWTGSAAELATRNHIAVFPTGGWWRERRKLGRSDRRARFALVVSIDTAATDVDIYTPVEALVGVPVAQPILT